MDIWAEGCTDVTTNCYDFQNYVYNQFNKFLSVTSVQASNISQTMNQFISLYYLGLRVDEVEV
jgi:hypothetical protein